MERLKIYFVAKVWDKYRCQVLINLIADPVILMAIKIRLLGKV